MLNFLKSKEIKATIFFFLCLLIQKSIGIITTPIFTRLLSEDEYGQYNVFNSWLGILGVIISLRLSYGVYSQGIIKFSEDKDRYSSSTQGLNIALILFWTAIYFITPNFWNKVLGLTTIQVLAIFVLVWGTSAFEFWACEKRASYSYKPLVIYILVFSIVKPVFEILFVVYSKDKVTARILAIALVELLFVPILCIIHFVRGKLFFSANYWKYSVLFNLPLIPHYLSQTVLNNSDRIMIERLENEASAGIYSLGYSVATLSLLISIALSQSITPWIFTKIKENKVSEIPQIVYLTFILMSIVSFFLIAFAPEIVRFFAPKSYHDAIWIIPSVTIGVYFIYCYDIFSKFAFYFEKTVFVMVFSVVSSLLNILLNYLFIPKYGYYAAAYTTLLCYFLYAALNYCFMVYLTRKKYGGMRVFDTKKIVVITSILMAVGAVCLILYKHTLLRYFSIVFTGFLLLLFWKKLYASIQTILRIKFSPK